MLFSIVSASLFVAATHAASVVLCDHPLTGYQCSPNVSHHWGMNSPFFALPSAISTELPPKCDLTFIQLLSRHGARNPTTAKTTAYNVTIAKIKANVSSSAFVGEYAFLANYSYTLGANDLTVFGQQEMANSGLAFFERYAAIAAANTPFVRSSGEARVVESSQNWTQGFHGAKVAAGVPDPDYPYFLVTIPEATGSNNTLNHDLCNDFENNATYTDIVTVAQANYTDTWIPAVQARLNAALPGANFTSTDTINMMDLCPFNTIANTYGEISAFCSLFTLEEWQKYDYWETLGKYYAYGAGNPLGPTNGVGWSNELIARLTSTAVIDHTSTNSTLDTNPATFPLNRTIYADFSHDNDMTTMFFALGFFNNTPTLSTTSAMSLAETNGYSATWTVPFSARAYFEKMVCDGESEELIRVIINDRVHPLNNVCAADTLGRCKVSDFVNALTFVKEGGLWNECFV